MKTLIRCIGNLFCLVAAMAFLTSVSLFILGGFILTFPVLRVSPRNRRVQAATQIISAGMALLSTFESSPKKGTSKTPSDLQSYE
jgi:hypothetical protein